MGGEGKTSLWWPGFTHRSPEDILACLRKHLPLVLKCPGSGSNGHLEAVLTESGLVGRFLSQVATSMGCCMVFQT